MTFCWFESLTRSTPAANRWSWAWLILTAPLWVGCSTEVPYGDSAAEAQTEQSEAPAFDPEAGEPTTEAPEEPTEAPEDDDRYGEVAVPEGLPWETDKPDSESSAEADRLFGGTTGTPPAANDTAEKVAEASAEDQDSDSFEDFLGKAYGLNNEEPPAEEAVASTTPQELPESETQPAPPVTEGLPAGAEDLFAKSEEPAADPETQAPTAKPPTTTAPADSDVLAELWGDEPVPEDSRSAEPQAEPEPKPSIFADIEQEDPVEEPPAELPEPSEAPSTDETFAFDDPPPAEKSTETIEEKEEWVKPAESLPSVAQEQASPTQRVASIEPRAPRSAPMASSAIKPLPSVPVLPYNTRHLSWLLGGKLGLAELADLDGATPNEIAAWTDEVDRLARELQIPDPSSKTNETDPAKRVRQMMAAAARAGEALASEHGIDHAALLEISLKTNALLVVAEDRPELASPVAAAVRAAAERAVLPRFLWEETVQTLERQPTAEQTLATVSRLHERVESFLR